MTHSVQIYVRLLEENLEVFRPVEANRINNNEYKILETNLYDPDLEEWEFKPGEKVLCVNKITKDGEILLAIKIL